MKRVLLGIGLGVALLYVVTPILLAVPVALFLVSIAGVPSELFWVCFPLALLLAAPVIRTALIRLFFGRAR